MSEKIITKSKFKRKSNVDISKMIMLGLFSALAFLTCFVLHFKLEFLSFEPKDAVIVIAGFVYGPIAGLVVSIVAAVIEMLIISTTGPYGLIMNIGASFAFVGVASIIYKYKKSISGAVIGLIAGTLSMTAVMICLNLLVTPIYMGAPREAVVDMILPLLLPFNLLKGVFSSAVTLLIYKPAVTAFRAVGLIPKGESEVKYGKKTVAITVISVAVIVIAFVIFIFGLKGNFKIR